VTVSTRDRYGCDVARRATFVDRRTMKWRPRAQLQLQAAGAVAVGLLAGAGTVATEPVRKSSGCIELDCAPVILSVAVVTCAICVIVATATLYPSVAHNRAGLLTRGRPLLYATAGGVGWIMFAGVGLYLLLAVVLGPDPGLPMWSYATIVAVSTIGVGAWAHRSVRRGGWELAVFRVLTGLAAGVVIIVFFGAAVVFNR